MSKAAKKIQWMLHAFALGVAAPAWAQETAISSQEAVQRALEQNPSLAATVAQQAQSEGTLLTAEGLLDPTLTVTAGYTRSKNPSLSADGVLTATNENLTTQALLRKQFSLGTTVQLSAGTTWQQSRSPLFFTGTGGTTSQGAAGEVRRFGPGYGINTRLQVTQPLLRGAGNAVLLASERQAKAQLETSRASRRRATSELVRDVLVAYWELWYAQRALDIQQSAIARTERQRDEAAARARTGSLAPADVLQFETDLATQQESMTQAELLVQTNSLALGRLLGVSNLMSAQVSEPPTAAVPGQELERLATDSSLEVKEQRAQVEVANVQAKTAGDSYRHRLDLDAYVQAQGLGNNDPGAAMSQLAHMNAVSAYVGVTYEWPLSDRRHRGADLQATKTLLSAQRNLDATTQRVEVDVKTAQATYQANQKRQELAERTAEIANKQHDAEQARYQSGSSTALQVTQAREQARNAELRVARARADVAEAAVRVLHLVGTLLEQERVQLD